jgi:hypothetical protein
VKGRFPVTDMTRENALEEAAVLTSIGLPELLKKLFGADKKSAFFQCQSKY